VNDNDQPDPEKKIGAPPSESPQDKSDADVEQEKKAQENAPPPPLDEIKREAPPPRSTDE